MRDEEMGRDYAERGGALDDRAWHPSVRKEEIPLGPARAHPPAARVHAIAQPPSQPPARRDPLHRSAPEPNKKTVPRAKRYVAFLGPPRDSTIDTERPVLKPLMYYAPCFAVVMLIVDVVEVVVTYVDKDNRRKWDDGAAEGLFKMDDGGSDFYIGATIASMLTIALLGVVSLAMNFRPNYWVLCITSTVCGIAMGIKSIAVTNCSKSFKTLVRVGLYTNVFCHIYFLCTVACQLRYIVIILYH